MSKFHNIDQNSEDWDDLRRGKFTASSFSDLFMDPKTKGYNDAIIKVAYEKVTGSSTGFAGNYWTNRGHEMEHFAFEYYEEQNFCTLENGGFYEYSEFVGASPDAKIQGENAGCEFKCPAPNTYNEYLRTQKIPKNYLWQIHGQLLCTGWDYIDYMPFYSPKIKPIQIRVERDDKILIELKDRLEYCIEEVKTLINQIKL